MASSSCSSPYGLPQYSPIDPRDAKISRLEARIAELEAPEREMNRKIGCCIISAAATFILYFIFYFILHFGFGFIDLDDHSFSMMWLLFVLPVSAKNNLR
jgi:hypothetical protein